MILQKNILYEDNHLIIVNKQAGEIVQGDKTGDKPLSEILKDYIKEKYNKPGKVFLGVPHRIDRPVSGVIVFARTSKALERMNLLFKNKDIQKTYWAVVRKGDLKSKDKLIHYLVKNEKQNKSYAYDFEKPGTKKAELDYTIIKHSDTFMLLEVDLKTGRHHQIRCQLAKMGFPVKGDLKYGYPRSNPDGGISLHARQIRFIHPVSKTEVNVVADLPEDKVWRLFV